MSRVTSATESTGVCTARKTASSNMAASLGHGRRRVFGRKKQVKVGSATDGRLQVHLDTAPHDPTAHDPVHPRGIELRVDVVDQDAGADRSPAQPYGARAIAVPASRNSRRVSMEPPQAKKQEPQSQRLDEMVQRVVIEVRRMERE